MRLTVWKGPLITQRPIPRSSVVCTSPNMLSNDLHVQPTHCSHPPGHPPLNILFAVLSKFLYYTNRNFPCFCMGTPWTPISSSCIIWTICPQWLLGKLHTGLTSARIHSLQPQASVQCGACCQSRRFMLSCVQLITVPEEQAPFAVPLWSRSCSIRDVEHFHTEHLLPSGGCSTQLWIISTWLSSRRMAHLFLKMRCMIAGTSCTCVIYVICSCEMISSATSLCFLWSQAFLRVFEA